jgi:excisionase family DNA binding protein
MQQTEERVIEERRATQRARLRALLDRQEAGTYLGCSARRVDELRKTGQLLAVRDGRFWKFLLDDLDDYIAGLTRSA